MLTRTLATLLPAALAVPVAASGLTFTPLGDLAGGDFSSFAYAVSADGSTVVGTSSALLDFEAFRWTQATGMVTLGDLPTGGNESRALATDADGSRVVGQGTITGGAEAFTWDAPLGPMQGIGHLDPAGNPLLSIANGVSADGSVVVGHSNSTAGTEAFVYTAGGGMVPLGDFADGPVFSVANAVSADGTVVVGGGAHFGGPNEGEAAMWVDGGSGYGSIVGLGTLAGGQNRSLALGVSDDGSTVVGAASSANSTLGDSEAFRWTSVLSMQGLGDLPGGDFDSEALDASADGSVIVGRATDASGDRAFIWTEAAGMLDLNALVASLLPAGWALEAAYGISADGLTIVGAGSNADGNNEGWIITLDSAPVPEPGTGLLLGLGLVALALRRDR